MYQYTYPMYYLFLKEVVFIYIIYVCRFFVKNLKKFQVIKFRIRLFDREGTRGDSNQGRMDTRALAGPGSGSNCCS